MADTLSGLNYRRPLDRYRQPIKYLRWQIRDKSFQFGRIFKCIFKSDIEYLCCIYCSRIFVFVWNHPHGKDFNDNGIKGTATFSGDHKVQKRNFYTEIHPCLRFLIFKLAFFNRLLLSIASSSIWYFFGYMVLLISFSAPDDSWYSQTTLKCELGSASTFASSSVDCRLPSWGLGQVICPIIGFWRTSSEYVRECSPSFRAKLYAMQW